MPVDPKNTEQRQATSIADWNASSAPAETQEVEGFFVDLPSGNVVFMKRDLSMPTMLATGRIPNPLAGIVQGLIDSGQREFNAKAFEKHLEDPRVNLQILDLTHEAVVRCVIAPEFDMPPARGKVMGKDGKRVRETAEAYMDRLADWQPELSDKGKFEHAVVEHETNDRGEQICNCERKISVWSMNMDDRFYIFSVAQGAAADLASFRAEQERVVADLSASEGVRKSPKRTGGARSKK